MPKPEDGAACGRPGSRARARQWEELNQILESKGSCSGRVILLMEGRRRVISDSNMLLEERYGKYTFPEGCFSNDVIFDIEVENWQTQNPGSSSGSRCSQLPCAPGLELEVLHPLPGCSVPAPCSYGWGPSRTGDHTRLPPDTTCLGVAVTTC